MNVKHEAEKNLIEHYESNVKYQSSINVNNLDSVLSYTEIDVSNIDNADILDIGCGDGRLCRFMRDHHNVNAVGVDYSKSRIEKARQLSDNKCEYYVCDINLFEPTSMFDFMFIFETLEHLVDPLSVLKRYQKYLKDGGSIIGSVPLNMPYKAHLQVFTSIEDVENKLNVNVVRVFRGKYALFVQNKT